MATRPPPSPEYKAIKACYHKLVISVERSPEDTLDKLFSKGLIIEEEKRKLRGNHDDADKARKMIDSVLNQLKGCNSSEAKRELFRQFIDSLVVIETVKKELEEFLRSFLEKDHPLEQAKEYQLLQTQLSKWEQTSCSLRTGFNEILSQESSDLKTEGLEAQLTAWEQHKENLGEIEEKSSELVVTTEDYRERIRRNYRQVQNQLREIENSLKLEKIKQDIEKSEKKFSDRLQYLQDREKEFYKQRESVQQKFKDFEKVEQLYRRKQKDCENLTNQWEELVENQRGKLGFFKNLLSEEFDHNYLQKFQLQLIESQDGLKYSRELRNHLENLEERGTALEHVEGAMRERLDVLSMQREAFQKAKKELESVQAANEEYKQTMHYCEKKLEGCDKMVRECSQEIEAIAKEYQWCIEGFCNN